jgi:GNAT superfamily N-acetyltransferase
VLQTSFGRGPLYYLNALRTVPAHRSRGLASKLIKQVLDEADSKGLRVGLYTDGEGKAKPLYDKLGFVEAGRFEIDLEQHGGHGRHVEISMIRDPVLRT